MPPFEGLSAVAAFFSILLGTFVSEDATLISTCVLAADGRLSPGLVFWSNWAGIAIGDLLLYLAARGLLGRGRLRRWIEGRAPQSLARGEGLFRRYGWMSLLLARFLPGTRVAIYAGAGALRYPWFPFSVIIAGTGAVWVAAWVYWIRPGERFPWFVPVLALLAVFGFFRAVVKAGGMRAWFYGWWRHRAFEYWSPYVFYVPVVTYYLWLAFRYRDLTLPSAANPRIRFGGWIGESKTEILEPLRAFPEFFLPYRVFEPGTSAATIEAFLREAGLSLPVILKPDIGQRGSGVVLARTMEAVATAAASYRTQFLVQKYCAWENEAGVFYARHPGQATGQLYSITEKQFPSVVGDGVLPLRELILRHPRAKWMASTFLRRHAERLAEVLPAGEKFRLVQSGNHCQGTVFLDGQRWATDALRASLDRISHGLELYVGRFDIRFESEARLREGKNFSIVEINGAGAEATHIYAPGLGLFRAYGILFRQWDLLFAIADANRRRGFRAMGVYRFFAEIYSYRRGQKFHPPTT